MVSVMVGTFREMQLRLGETIERYETPEFKELDRNTSAAFEAIYRHIPRDAGEARTMVAFFLDIIEANDAGDSSHLIERIRSIVGNLADLDPPPMEIAHGAGI